MVMGLLPDQFWDMTLREVIWYNNGFVRRNKMMWDHTSSLMALHANIAQQGKGKRFSPNDFNPYSDLDNAEGVSNAAEAQEFLESLKQF